MLGRATKAYEPSTKNDLAKQLFPSSSPAQNGNIEEQFKKARQASQSIGAFTGFTNSASVVNALGTKPANIRNGPKRKLETVSRASTASLLSVLSRTDSFQDTPDTLHSTTDKYLHNNGSQQAVVFDENDFEDDADLDLDVDYEIPISMPAPSDPSQIRASTSKSPYSLPRLLQSASRPHASQNMPSSAPTWSSSSPSHKAPPPGMLVRQQQEQASTQESSIPYRDVDVEPGRKKRRTLPWMQQRGEEDEIAAREEERAASIAVGVPSGSSSPPTQRCFKCKKTGHYVQNCPEHGKKKPTPPIFTPKAKDKDMPWNHTGSAVAEQKRGLKNKYKSARKLDEAVHEDLDQHNRKKAAMSPITLSDEQKRVQDLVVNQNKSVFFTGSAGTGKSVLMRSIIAELRKRHVRDPERVAVTASTGLAACNIGGVTLHSFGGIGLGKEDVPTLVKKIKRNPKAKSRWLKTKVLIIDEISMVDGDLFDKLEGIARAMRNNGRPFGGIQLVITGDFFQLPPVPDYDNKARGAKFAFDAGTWSTAIHHTIGLTEVFRQKDPVFANMLNEMRLGRITDDTVKAFRKLSRPVQYEDGLTATELFPTRNEVENSNFLRMRELVGKAYKYEAKDSGTITDVNIREKLLANMMAPKVMELKKGAQVMLIKNMDDGLVNGSLGKVISFMSPEQFDIWYKDPDVFDENIATEDLDDDQRAARISIGKFSRTGSKSTLPDTSPIYPLVQFSVADGTSRDLLVMPEEWKVELPNGEIQAQREQLPLILAWALSIHKAQGQTLERVRIDLKKVFEKGQAYVALSRATSQNGLEVHGFEKSKVMAHPRVAEFYNSLYSVNKALEHPIVANAIPTKQVAENEKVAKTAKLERRTSYGFDNDEEEAMAAYG